MKFTVDGSIDKKVSIEVTFLEKNLSSAPGARIKKKKKEEKEIRFWARGQNKKNFLVENKKKKFERICRGSNCQFFL